jgi:3-deoxy-manno-octulosonate cytidylyltransferase (CMP-KDO synthetase)
MAATRLPGKPLAEIGGRPMIQWVHDSVARARGVDAVVVATDDTRIVEAVRAFGGVAELTGSELASGTDRVAAVSRLPAYERFGIVVNAQGDEPFLEPRAVELAVELVRSERFELATVMTPLRTEEELLHPAVVKVLADGQDRAVYFSRHPIPYSRQPRPASGEGFACRRHVGLYAYRRELLLRMSAWPPSPWERGEMLEQLRALERGVAIGVRELDFVSIGVDTPEDLEAARRRAAELGSEARQAGAGG